jgi:hypothetical protein
LSPTSRKNGNSNGNFIPMNRVQKPEKIDNWTLLARVGSTALSQGLNLGVDIEVIPPPVYLAFESWYGGGPMIIRKVVPVQKYNDNDPLLTSSSPSNAQLGDIEFFPLKILLCFCDEDGKAAIPSREVLFSRQSKIEEAILDISKQKRLSSQSIRFWNYGKEDWRAQYVLSPDLTFEEANIQDGQRILVECSLQDGSWPRAQLQTKLHEQQNSVTNETDTSLSTTENPSVKEHDLKLTEEVSVENKIEDEQNSIITVQPKRVRLHNQGLVGLDNLGNTCYLNSSLQALLHSDLLLEYFISNRYLDDLNILNKHGYQGKLASTFGKLAQDLWTTRYEYITPRNLYHEIANMRDQFAGNEQHDAHEFLSFMLDGLSEDLNFVHTKPYIEQPDSDSRPDYELANIWWENHLRRDKSIIQSMFTGQFKSTMKCKCGFSSSRYEPFNVLSVPIPDDTTCVITVIVIPRKLDKSIRLMIRFQKTNTIRDAISTLPSYGIAGLDYFFIKEEQNDLGSSSTTNGANLSENSTNSKVDPPFLVGELQNMRIQSFINLDRKLENLKDAELLVFFETAVPFLRKKMNVQQISKSKKSSTSGDDGSLETIAPIIVEGKEGQQREESAEIIRNIISKCSNPWVNTLLLLLLLLLLPFLLLKI